MTLLMTIVVFGLLIFIHELGHFLAARSGGVRVHEFALGFGPRLFSRLNGGTEYSLRAVPLGGFVRMAGMHPREEDLESVPRDQWFLNKSVGRRMGIIAAGPAMNVALAVILFTLLFAVLGVAEPTLEVRATEPGYPAVEAGMRPGDRIVAVDGRAVDTWDDLVQMVQASPGRPLSFTVVREGTRQDIAITPDRRPDGTGIIGIEPVLVNRRSGPVQAVGEGVLWTGQVTVAFFDAITRTVRGQGGADIIGPVGIGQHIGEATRTGLPNLIFLTALLSANLALINILPIPALDGSRLVFLAWEWVRGRPVDPEKESFVHLVGFALLLLLAFIITYRDILRLT